MVAPALIGAGASLLGGLFGRNSQKKAQARQNEYDKPINMRKRMEEGGFNPLLGVAGLSMNQQTVNHQPIMGNAIASAGMAYAGAMRDKQQLDLEKQKLELQTKELDELLKRQTIRPKIGGVYASNQLTPSRGGVGAGVGGSAAGGIPSTGANLPLPFYANESELIGRKPDLPDGQKEHDRLDLDKGGSVQDKNLYEIDMPFGFKFHTRRPMFGERSEAYAGDVGQIPLVAAQMIEDVGNNLAGRKVNPQTGEWMSNPDAVKRRSVHDFLTKKIPATAKAKFDRDRAEKERRINEHKKYQQSIFDYKRQ